MTANDNIVRSAAIAAVFALALSGAADAQFKFNGLRRAPRRQDSQEQPSAQPSRRTSLLSRQPAGSSEAAAEPLNADAGGAASSGEAPALNWDAAPVDIVLQAYGERIGKTILKDPQVPAATITLKSRAGQKLTNDEYLEAIEVILEMNQIHLEPYGENFIRAIPRKSVRKDGIPLYMDVDSMEIDAKSGRINDGKVISLMITFSNIGTEEAQKALEGFKSDSGILLVFERTNSILATDTKQNIDRMVQIVKAIDIATPVTEVVEYIQIKYASANDVKQVIDNIVAESMKEQEKSGKAAAAPRVQPQPVQQIGPPRLRRLGGQQTAQTPVNQESLVMSISDADRGMIRGKVVTIADERSNKILIITSQVNMKFFKDVIAALDVETTPDVQVKVYRLKYAEAEDVADMINDLIGNSASSKSSGSANQNQNARQGTSGSVTRNTVNSRGSVNQRSGDRKVGELNKDNVTVLADKRINGIVVMARTEDIPTLEQIIESMDIKLSQVLIETVIIEVMLGDGIETGMDWVQKGRREAQVEEQAKNSLGQQLFYKTRTITKSDGTESSTSILSDPVPAGYERTYRTTADDKGVYSEIKETASEVAAMIHRNVVERDGIANNYYGATAVGLAGGAGNGAAAYGIAAGTEAASNVFSHAFNFIFDSDELGLSAILQATKSDSRSKYVASPIVMTLDNKEAIVNATRMKYLLKGFTSSGNSYSTIAVPDYEQKELGIELKITPKINPNGTVMLTVEEKYTQVGADQTIQYASSNGGTGTGSALQPVQVPTTITREMSADVLLENNQTVVFGGLTETTVSESEAGIPFLQDIPFIGKWLFSKVKQNEDRVELLVFMTPYVLNDAEAAQAEAIRRKKTLSDPRPWEDNGWSKSELADPVSRREQMRRFREEWKKQDEERQTKIAIEKAKVERAKKLKEMSQAERDVWLKMHKEELEEEQQKELEEKMLDKDSQEELRKLAEKVRANRLEDAEKIIKKAEKEIATENERARLAAESKPDDGSSVPKAVKDESLTEIKPDSKPTEVKPAEVKPVETKPSTEAKPVVGAKPVEAKPAEEVKPAGGN
ncbi:MAG: hypothetical protein J6T01_03500 [Kiritimatiellae bacterium]|nr:hypothetical protein [Kiritimatiellia bacterium]